MKQWSPVTIQTGVSILKILKSRSLFIIKRRFAMKKLCLIAMLAITLFGCTKSVENTSGQSTSSTSKVTTPAYKNGLFTLQANNVWNGPQPVSSVSLSVTKLLLSDTASPGIGFFRVKKYNLSNSQVGYNIYANYEPASGSSQFSSISFVSNYLKDPNETQISINARLYDDINVYINNKWYKGDKLVIYHEKGNIESGTYEFSGYADSGHKIVCTGSYSFK